MIAVLPAGAATAIVAIGALRSGTTNAPRPARAWPAALFVDAATDGSAIPPGAALAVPAPAVPPQSAGPAALRPPAVEGGVAALGARNAGPSPDLRALQFHGVASEALLAEITERLDAAPAETAADPGQSAGTTADACARTVATRIFNSEISIVDSSSRQSATEHDGVLLATLSDVERDGPLSANDLADVLVSNPPVVQAPAVPLLVTAFRLLPISAASRPSISDEATSFVLGGAANDIPRAPGARLAKEAQGPQVLLSGPDFASDLVEIVASRNISAVAPSNPAIVPPGVSLVPSVTSDAATVQSSAPSQAVITDSSQILEPGSTAVAAVIGSFIVARAAAPTDAEVPVAPHLSSHDVPNEAARATQGQSPTSRALKVLPTVERRAVLRPAPETPTGSFAPAFGPSIFVGGSTPPPAVTASSAATPEILAPPTIEARGAGLFEVATDGLGPVRIAIEAADIQLSVRLTVDRGAAAQLLIVGSERLDAALGNAGQRLDTLSVDVRGGDGGRRGPPPQTALNPTPTPHPTPRVAAPPRPPLADRYA